MSDATDEELPPLGEPTPSGPSPPASRRTRLPVVIAAAVALFVGLAAGFGLATVLDDDGGSEAVRRPAAETPTTGPPTTADTLPEECVATMRSAQQTLQLLDQGLRDLRNLNLGEVDGAVREVQQLREGLDADVRRCLELMGD